MPPLNFTIVSADTNDFLSVDPVRQMFADLITAHVDPTGALGVKIFSHWVYKVDIHTLLGRVTADLKVSKEDSTEFDKVHCWTIGTSNALVERDQGMMIPIIGGQGTQYHREHQIDIWGFFEDDGKRESQKAAEDEARLIQAAFIRNTDLMLSQTDKLRKIWPLEFTNTARQPFSEGGSVIVASGVLKIQIAEDLSA